jgi:hypothetical protein
MKEENPFYDHWKTHRRQIVVPEHFTADVMQHIRIATAPENNECPLELVDRQSRLVSWSAAGGLILLGVFRILFIIANLMRPQMLMP